MLAGIGNQVAFWWMRCQFYINPNYSAFFSCIHFPLVSLGMLQVQSVMQNVWILLSEQPLTPQKRMGDYYHKHHAGHPCLRGALCEAPRKKHTALFPLNTHMFALHSPHNCCSTNPVVSWGGDSCMGFVKREGTDRDQSFCLSFTESIAFFFPLKRRRKEEKMNDKFRHGY